MLVGSLLQRPATAPHALTAAGHSAEQLQTLLQVTRARLVAAKAVNALAALAAQYLPDAASSPQLQACKQALQAARDDAAGVEQLLQEQTAAAAAKVAHQAQYEAAVQAHIKALEACAGGRTVAGGGKAAAQSHMPRRQGNVVCAADVCRTPHQQACMPACTCCVCVCVAHHILPACTAVRWTLTRHLRCTSRRGCCAGWPTG